MTAKIASPKQFPPRGQETPIPEAKRDHPVPVPNADGKVEAQALGP
jgi:hypothetical protein